jgi:hypothetical protein
MSLTNVSLYLFFFHTKNRIRVSRRLVSYWRKPKVESARDALAKMIVSHVPVTAFNYHPKCVCKYACSFLVL